MGTARSHNKLAPVRRTAKPLMNRQRARKQHAIHNRGNGAQHMNEEQRTEGSDIPPAPQGDGDPGTTQTEPATEAPAEEEGEKTE